MRIARFANRSSLQGVAPAVAAVFFFLGFGCGGDDGGGGGQSLSVARGASLTVTLEVSARLPDGATLVECSTESEETTIEPDFAASSLRLPITGAGFEPAGVEGDNCTTDLTIEPSANTICETYTVTQPFSYSYTQPDGDPPAGCDADFGDSDFCVVETEITVTVTGCPPTDPDVSCTQCAKEYSYNGFGGQITTRNECDAIPNYASDCGNPGPGGTCVDRVAVAFNGFGQVIFEIVDTCQRAD